MNNFASGDLIGPSLREKIWSQIAHILKAKSAFYIFPALLSFETFSIDIQLQETIREKNFVSCTLST